MTDQPRAGEDADEMAVLGVITQAIYRDALMDDDAAPPYEWAVLSALRAMDRETLLRALDA